MLMDKNLQFSAAQAITATAASTNTYDLETGLLVTTTFVKSPAAEIGNATYFGEDLGLGQGKGTPVILVKTGTAFATLTTLQVSFQGAPMNNTAFASGNVSDLVFVSYIQTAAIGVALLTANTEIAVIKWPVRQIGQALPRFDNLNYIVGGSNATTGTINADVSLGADTAQGSLGQYPSNY